MNTLSIYQLELPHPSISIIDCVNRYVDNLILDTSKKEWLDQYHHNSINSALHSFTTNEELTQLINDEYGRFFPDIDIMSVVGVMRSADKTPACQPPHIDRRRSLAINYYFDLGGQDVTTSFYDFSDTIQIDASSNFQYNDFKKIGHCIFDKNQWYAYNVSRCHSVENITGTRYFLSICPKDNTTYKVENLINNKLINARSIDYDI